MYVCNLRQSILFFFGDGGICYKHVYFVHMCLCAKHICIFACMCAYDHVHMYIYAIDKSMCMIMVCVRACVLFYIHENPNACGEFIRCKACLCVLYGLRYMCICACIIRCTLGIWLSALSNLTWREGMKKRGSLACADRCRVAARLNMTRGKPVKCAANPGSCHVLWCVLKQRLDTLLLFPLYVVGQTSVDLFLEKARKP